MYSANCYADSTYSIGYATAKSPLGPYNKYENNPILAADLRWDYVSGTGHNSITVSPDGSEMYIVYHTHTMPGIGGGNRQINIDKMGFRKDGSIYVNGPTVTEQLMPAGSIKYGNISNEAKIKASSTKAGYFKETVVDGEISIHENNIANNWVSEENNKEEWLELSWSRKRTISNVMLYKSPLPEHAADEYELKLSTGEVIRDISFPEEAGGAAIISFDEKKVKSVKIIMKKKSGNVGISEIVVVGK